MTRILLCAGPALLVVQRDGLLFFRRPGEADARVPYAPEHYPVFLSSARRKYDLTPVIGPHGEREPLLPEGSGIPALRPEHLSSGEVVYRVVEEVPGQTGEGNLGESLAPVDGGGAEQSSQRWRPSDSTA